MLLDLSRSIRQKFLLQTQQNPIFEFEQTMPNHYSCNQATLSPSLSLLAQPITNEKNTSMLTQKNESISFHKKQMASQMSNVSANDEDDLANVEDIEQLCTRISKYDPCFRLSLIQYHLKRSGISCNDERLVKLLSLSFETMIRSIIIDCARVNKDNNNQSKTLTSELLTQTLLNTTTDNNNQTITNSQQSTSDVNDFFDL